MTAGRTVAILVAAGKGERAGAGAPKQYRRIAGKSLVGHALESLRAHPGIDDLLVVIGSGQENALADALDGGPLPSVVTGGAARQDSVLAGLEWIAAHGGADRVLIHDAARPFLPAAVIDRLLATEGAAVPVLPVVDTLARVGGRLGDTVDRSGLVRVQTPQAFPFAAILAAHRSAKGAAATDDAQIARGSGMKVELVEGDAMLEKLTHAADFDAAERRHDVKLTPRIGMGYDVHRLAAGETLWLGGIEIAHDKGLAGHSDADVALHALVDAILGALAQGDIGSHFPPSDPQWRGAASSRFVEHARDMVTARGGTIAHVDLTIICEAPKIGPHRDAMRSRIGGLLGIAIDRVSVKATTTERLGFAGRGEGIAAHALATVMVPDAETNMIDTLLPAELVDKAREVIEANRALGRIIAVAESCTGGLVSAALTEIPGSSDVLGAGFVTYSNEAKISVLRVSEDVLDTFGAVSIATAWAMAQGALEASGADVAVAITGIAGPGGGSPAKPVGTVVFARAEKGDHPDQAKADMHNFADNGRGGVRLQAALCALELLLPEPAP